MKYSKLAVYAITAAAITGCSLEMPKAPQGGLKILIDPQPEAQFYSSSIDGPSIQTPTSITNFNCFAVNVTGSSIPPNLNRLNGCSSTNNFGGSGVGRIEGLVARGQAVVMDVPSGSGHRIDVLGIYPQSGTCSGGGGGGGGGSPSFSDTGEQYGYVVGRATVDLLEPKSVTIPVSFSTGTPISLTCKDFEKFIPAFNAPASGQIFEVGCVAAGSVASTAPGTGAQIVDASYGPAVTEDGSLFLGTGCTTSSAQFILEMRWNVSGQNITRFESLEILWKGQAGVVSTCSTAPTASTGATGQPAFQIYNFSTSTWESYSSAPGISLQTYSLYKSPVGQYVSSSGIVAARIVGGEVLSAGQCSVAQTDAVQLRLKYARK